MTDVEASAPPPPTPRPGYLRWWFVLIVLLAALAVVGSLLPRTGSRSAPPPSPASTPSTSSAPSAVAVTAHMLAALGQPTLQQACEKDRVAWACNVVSIDPLDDSELRVRVTALAPGESGAVVALEFRTHIAAGPDSPMPGLRRVIVVDPAGNELGSAQ